MLGEQGTSKWEGVRTHVITARQDADILREKERGWVLGGRQTKGEVSRGEGEMVPSFFTDDFKVRKESDSKDLSWS